MTGNAKKAPDSPLGRWIVAGALLQLTILAQTPPAASPPRFEVASVKAEVMQSGVPHIPARYAGQRLSGSDTLEQWIMFAWGMPPGIDSFSRLKFTKPAPEYQYYQVEALAPRGTTVDSARLMLRTLLADRMGLQCHAAQFDTPVYFLVRGSGPLKLKPPTGTDPSQGPRSMWVLRAKSAPITVFASYLSSFIHTDVVDKTGITGNFSFDLNSHDAMVAAFNSGDPGEVMSRTIGMATEQAKAFGLKLQAGKEKRDYLVVDHYNLMPTPN